MDAAELSIGRSAFSTTRFVRRRLVVYLDTSDQHPDIDDSIFNNLNLYSQFAAAAYCPSNNDNANNAAQITCPVYDNCPLVEADNVQSVYQFQK